MDGMVWCVLVCYDMVWYGMIWYGMVWYGMLTNHSCVIRSNSPYSCPMVIDLGFKTYVCTSSNGLPAGDILPFNEVIAFLRTS